MEDRILSERAAKRVLARAIELDDQRATGYSVAELRVTAAEAGVSPSAFQRALEEIEPSAPPAAVPWRRLTSSAALAGLSVGTAAGIADAVTQSVVSPFAMGVLLMVSGGVAMTGAVRSPLSALLRFGLGSSAAWATYAGAWAISAAAAGGADSISTFFMVRTALLGFGLSSVVGGAVAAWRAVRHSDAATTTGTALDVPLKRRVADRLKGWIDAWAKRVQVDTADDATRPMRA